jgi:serine protease Do
MSLMLLLAPAAPVLAQQQMPMMQLGMSGMAGGGADLLRKLLPSVVSINVRKDVAQANPGTNASGATSEVKASFGSGFVIDPSGVIATNSHVVQDAWQIDVTFFDGTRVPAHLLKATRLIDVAIIKVDVDRPLPALQWGDSDKLQIGDPVFTIGNGLGVGISVSGGIVSGLNRDIMDTPYDDYIQTDAVINHGNSGGPMFNDKGEVVGIDTALLSATSAFSGIGLAIPARNARAVINQLMHYGWLRPGWIGVKIQQLTPEMAQALHMARADGSIVAHLTDNGPAAEAGLRVGDVIMHLGTTTPTDERALLRGIATAPIDKPITLGLWRDGKEQTLDVTVKEWPRSQWEAIDAPVSMPASHHHVPPDLGITLAPLDDATRAQSGLANRPGGIVVTGVASGSDAAQHGLVAGDVILRVQEKTIATAADAQAAFDSARSAKLPFVLVLIEPKVHRSPGPEWMALRVAND